MDMVMIVMAALSAFVIREFPVFIALQPKLYNFPLKSYLAAVLMVVPFFILTYALEGLYDMKVTRNFWKETMRVFFATSIGLVVIIVAIFLKREWFSSRFIILTAWMLAVMYVTAGRYILNQIQRYLLKSRGIGVHRLLLIGHNGKIKRIQELVRKNYYLGYRIVGSIETASIHAIREIKEISGVDEIIVCDPTLTDSEQIKLIDYCAINNIAYKFIPTTLQTARFEAGLFNGEPIIEIRHTPLDGWGKILKRTFDIAGSFILLIIFSPIMLWQLWQSG